MVAVQQYFSPQERILTSARRLFATQGFHQTPVSELATAAEVSVGQIYRLFKDKNDVILAIVAEDIEARAFDLKALSKRAGEKSIPIKEAFVQLATLSMAKDESLSFEIMAEAYRSAEVAERIAEFCERYRFMLRELAIIANPDLSEQRRLGAEEVLLGLMFGLGHRTLSQPRLPIREAAELTANMIMAALTSEY